MIVYKYNNDGYYTGIHECQKGIKGETLFPSGNYTEIKPKLESGKIPQFVDGAWINKTDNRGKIYWDKATKNKIVWNQIDDYSGDELTEIEPPIDSNFYYWDDNQWVFDVNKYKKSIWKNLFALMKENIFEIIITKRETTPDFDFDDIVIKAKQFKENLATLTTKEEIDNAKESAISWMELVE